MTTTVAQPRRLERRRSPLARRLGRGRVAMVDLLALVVAATLACSPLAYGYYDITSWAPLGLAAVVLLVALLAARTRVLLSPHARLAAAGLALLVALSFSSLLWSESRDSAWSGANQVAVYAVIFAIGLLTIRGPASAWSVLVLIGSPALLTAGVLAVELVVGAGGGAFLGSRLNSPMGYVNGTAALLVMGVWPWIALAERLRSRWWSSAALGAAALITGTAALTQTRAILLAGAASVALTLFAAPGRARRSLNLGIVLAGAAACAHWTLRVYSSTAPTHLRAPGSSVLQAAGVALLASALLASLLRLLAHGSWPAPIRRHVASVRRARVLPAVAVAMALLLGGVAARGEITVGWHELAALTEAHSVDDRFLALGGGPRYDLWRIAVDEFAGDPLGGVGAGNYSDQEYQRRRGLEHVTNPHSLELRLLAELGVGGVLGLLLLAAPTLAAGLTSSRRLLTGADRSLRVAAVGVFTAWLACASVDWSYQIPGLTGMALLAAVVLLAPAARPVTIGAQRSWPDRVPLRPWVTLAACLGVLALLAASLSREYVATLRSDSGGALVRGHPLKALQALRSAEQLDPWSLQTQYYVAAAYARLDDYRGARAALRRAEQLEPENYVPPALLGDIARRAGRPTVALANYRRALRLDPLEPALERAIRETESAPA